MFSEVVRPAIECPGGTVVPLGGVTKVTIMGPPRRQVYEHMNMPNVKTVEFTDISCGGSGSEESFADHGRVYAKLLVYAFPNCVEFKIGAVFDMVQRNWWNTWKGRGYLFDVLKAVDSFERNTKFLKIGVDGNLAAFMEMVPPPSFKWHRELGDWDAPDYADEQREIYYYFSGSDRVLGGRDVVLSSSPCCAMYSGIHVSCPTDFACVDLHLMCQGCANLLPFIKLTENEESFVDV